MTAKRTDLHTRAMLVTLSISAWAARKYDKGISQEVADAHGADVSAGRYNKHLLPTKADVLKQQAKAAGVKVTASSPNSYKDLMQHIREVRDWHYANTLPWSDDGPRVLTVPNYQNYTDNMRKKQHKFRALLADFVTDYPALKAEAQRILNGMFNHEDYPDSVAERFDFAFRIDPIPAGGDFRVELSEEEIRVLSANTESRAIEAFENAQSDAVKRLYAVLANIHARLTETKVTKDRVTKSGKKISGGQIKGATFRDTLIDMPANSATFSSALTLPMIRNWSSTAVKRNCSRPRRSLRPCAITMQSAPIQHSGPRPFLTPCVAPMAAS